MSENKNAKKSSSESKGKFSNAIAKVGKFFREYRSELKKISWPTFAEVVKNTMITLVMVLIIGIIIWAVDWGVSTLRDTAIYAAKGSETVDSENRDKVYEDLLEAMSSYSDIVTNSDVVTRTDIAE